MSNVYLHKDCMASKFAFACTTLGGHQSRYADSVFILSFLNNNMPFAAKKYKKFMRYRKKSYLCNRLHRKACRSGGMVDTRDLKSLEHCAHTGSSPVSGTELEVSSRSSNFFVATAIRVCRGIAKHVKFVFGRIPSVLPFVSAYYLPLHIADAPAVRLGCYGCETRVLRGMLLAVVIG